MHLRSRGREEKGDGKREGRRFPPHIPTFPLTIPCLSPKQSILFTKLFLNSHIFTFFLVDLKMVTVLEAKSSGFSIHSFCTKHPLLRSQYGQEAGDGGGGVDGGEELGELGVQAVSPDGDVGAGIEHQSGIKRKDTRHQSSSLSCTPTKIRN